MTEQEAKDLADMKSAVNTAKQQAIDYMLHCHRNGVEHSGHKTIGSLCVGTVARLQAQINKLNDAFIKKYPD